MDGVLFSLCGNPKQTKQCWGFPVRHTPDFPGRDTCPRKGRPLRASMPGPGLEERALPEPCLLQVSLAEGVRILVAASPDFFCLKSGLLFVGSPENRKVNQKIQVTKEPTLDFPKKLKSEDPTQWQSRSPVLPMGVSLPLGTTSWFPPTIVVFNWKHLERLSQILASALVTPNAGEAFLISA